VAPWKLPLIVAAILVPVALAFFVGGPGVGVAVGALAAVAIVVVAVREVPGGPIAGAPPGDRRAHLLVVISRAVDEPAAIDQIAEEALGGGTGQPARVLVLAPARIGFLDRWASDVEGARRAAQQDLVVTVAALAKAEVEAEGRVGDESLVQAVEDQLRSFPATAVLLVTGGAEADPEGHEAAAELRRRLQVGFCHLVVAAPGP
jgi:hypothetical protein